MGNNNEFQVTPVSTIPPIPGSPDIPFLLKFSGDLPVELYSFTAIDRYFGISGLPFFWLETGADISVPARLFEGLRFPGIALADGAMDTKEGVYYFRCVDPGSYNSQGARSASYKLLSFRQELETGRFRDPEGIYPLLRELRDGSYNHAMEPWWMGLYPGTGYYRAVMDGALILARYGAGQAPPQEVINELLRSFQDLSPDSAPGGEEQRVFLTSLLMSCRPDLGLELLKDSGFVEELWPELALLDDVDHSKEFHPEGNVWKHTLETFRYRKTVRSQKTYDLRLSLGLLLHDVGKPLSESSGNRRFDGHAELGALVARKFLERLGFEASLIGDIFYLVKNHMLPAALPRLPLVRTEKIMASSLFPTLMELYRCDESSSFKGLDGYYESSAAYHSYLRYRRNPYRSADGKKLGKQQSL
jgi:poly(A) polymerase